MTDKELRRCRRIDLIEMIYYLKRENDELRAENDRLNSRIDTLIGAASAQTSAEEIPADNGTSEVGDQP